MHECKLLAIFTFLKNFGSTDRIFIAPMLTKSLHSSSVHPAKSTFKSNRLFLCGSQELRGKQALVSLE